MRFEKKREIQKTAKMKEGQNCPNIRQAQRKPQKTAISEILSYVLIFVGMRYKSLIISLRQIKQGKFGWPCTIKLYRIELRVYSLV